MRLIRTLLRHDFAGPLIRYGIAGACVALVYLGVPLLLHDVVGIPIEVAIPIALALALTVHFNLQRRFVFRHIDEFALTTRQQIGRYAVMAAIQYPTTAVATAVLPGLLDISSDAAFLIISAMISLTAFLLLRGHVFHPDIDGELLAEAGAEHRDKPPEAADDTRRAADPVGS
jgi:putative flippase GtrA